VRSGLRCGVCTPVYQAARAEHRGREIDAGKIDAGGESNDASLALLTNHAHTSRAHNARAHVVTRLRVN
jgi:hypothetical protein